MTKDHKWQGLLGITRRKAAGTLKQEHANLALAAQQITEESILKLAQTAQQITGSKNLVMAGGVALNSVANGKLLRSGICQKYFFQPAAGDAGGAMGAALCASYLREGSAKRFTMADVYLGPRYSEIEILRTLKKYSASYEHIASFKNLSEKVAALLAKGSIVGWFQGNLEFGPRALGNRSILADPRRPEMQARLNAEIKFREGFRPFAPAVLAEDASKYFDLKVPSPYMQVVCPIKGVKVPQKRAASLAASLKMVKTKIPAVTHIDGSGRVQTVSRSSNERFYALLKAFKAKTKLGMLVNTSFNVRGEPMVCSPEEAYLCFMKTGLDYLVIENFLLSKAEQPELSLPGAPLALD